MQIFNKEKKMLTQGRKFFFVYEIRVYVYVFFSLECMSVHLTECVWPYFLASGSALHVLS